jgi:hypothetical protein
VSMLSHISILVCITFFFPLKSILLTPIVSRLFRCGFSSAFLGLSSPSSPNSSNCRRVTSSCRQGSFSLGCYHGRR